MCHRARVTPCLAAAVGGAPPQAHVARRPAPCSSRSHVAALLSVSLWLSPLAVAPQHALAAADLDPALCKTEQCRQLLSRSPASPPLSAEEKRQRRIRAIALEEAEAKAAAGERAERLKLQPAYDAKSAAELFEARQALAEGTSKGEARARAERAGKLAFDTATQDVGQLERERATFEARLAERRAAVEASRAVAEVTVRGEGGK